MSEQDKQKYIQMLYEIREESDEIEEVRMCDKLISKISKNDVSESDLALLANMYEYHNS